MKRVVYVKQVFQAAAFFSIVQQHKWDCEAHQPLIFCEQLKYVENYRAKPDALCCKKDGNWHDSAYQAEQCKDSAIDSPVINKIPGNSNQYKQN